jgi:folate-dependent phosphoribosylglycinamide formyltransferase PurN
MKLGIVTTNDQHYSVVLLYYLLQKSLRPDFVILVCPGILRKIRRNLSLKSLIFFLKDLRKFPDKGTTEPRTDYLAEFIRTNGINIRFNVLLQACKDEKIPVYRVRDLNGKKIIDILKKNNSELLINAGGGIYRSGVIQAASKGILNAHMGYLPDFRGMNVLEWSLFYGEKIGVTLHFIDNGIDTGNILIFREIIPTKGDSIECLRNKSAVTNLELMVQVIQELPKGTIKPCEQAKNQGRQYFVMHPRLKCITEERLVRRFKKNT